MQSCVFVFHYLTMQIQQFIVCARVCEQGGMNVAGTLALESCLSTSFPSSVTVKDPAIDVLALLRILYGISKYWHSLYLVYTFCSARGYSAFSAVCSLCCLS